MESSQPDGRFTQRSRGLSLFIAIIYGIATVILVAVVTTGLKISDTHPASTGVRQVVNAAFWVVAIACATATVCQLVYAAVPHRNTEIWARFTAIAGLSLFGFMIVGVEIVKILK